MMEPQPINFDNTDPFSVSMWIKTTSSANESLIARRLQSGTFRGWVMFTNVGGEFGFQLVNTTISNLLQVETSGANIIDGNWHHVAFSYNGTDDESGLVLYLDGDIVTSRTITENTLSATTTASITTQIGAINGLQGFDGNIDDVAVYDKALTLAEVREIIGATEVPFSNNSMVFDRVDEHIVIGDVLNFERTDSFSISAWIKTSETVGFGVVVAKLDNTGPNPGYQLGVNFATGLLSMQIINNSSTNLIAVNMDDVVNDGTWRNIVITYDGSSMASGVNFYMNGTLRSDTDIANTLSASILTADPLQISGRDGANFTFDGNIDDVSIYDKELTSGEITTIYNSGNPNDLRTAGPTASLVGYWRMGDGATFPTIPDDSTNSNDGTATNMESADITPDFPFNSAVPATLITTDSTTVGPFVNLVGYWTMGDQASAPAFPIHPIALYGDYGFHGHHGFIDDMWWGPSVQGSPTGSTYPNDPDNRQFAQVGDIVFPWLEDSTLPLMGGTATIVNDTFDAHFIDTSDVAGAGLTKLFQMEGIDSGNPSQPAYHNWVVTVTPDPTGALAIGPDAPPFGGPLVGIIISAEWVD